MKKRSSIALMVILNVNCLVLASSELSTVHDWIRTEYGENMFLSVLSDITAGFPGALTTWNASASETNLSLFIAEAYCRYMISDEAIKANQMLKRNRYAE